MGLEAASGPAQGAVRRTFGVGFVRRIRNAFVKRHGNVRPQFFLDAHGNFRRQELLRAVDVGPEKDALLRDFPHGAQAEDLKAPAVRQHAPVVIHEAVQSAGSLDETTAGAQEQMVCVGQDDLAAHLIQLFRRQGLDRGLRADGHEHVSFLR